MLVGFAISNLLDWNRHHTERERRIAGCVCDFYSDAPIIARCVPDGARSKGCSLIELDHSSGSQDFRQTPLSALIPEMLRKMHHVSPVRTVQERLDIYIAGIPDALLVHSMI